MRKRIYISLVVFALAVVVYYPFSPGGRQAGNLRRAGQFIAQNYAAIHSDPRFAEIDMLPLTAAGGCIDVGGSIGSQADLEQLKRCVMDRHPPVCVMWHVSVMPAPADTRPRP